MNIITKAWYWIGSMWCAFGTASQEMPKHSTGWWIVALIMLFGAYCAYRLPIEARDEQ